MKLKSISLTAIAILTFAATSCMPKDVYNTRRVIGTWHIEKDSLNTGYSRYFYTTTAPEQALLGRKIVLNSPTLQYRYTKEGQRSCLYFNIEEIPQEADKILYGEFVSMENLLTKEVVLTDEPDTLGTAPLAITYANMSYDEIARSWYLDISVSVRTGSNRKHSINLAHLDSESYINEDGHLILYLRHGTEGEDTDSESVAGANVSFKLNLSSGAKMTGLRLHYNALQNDGKDSLLSYDFPEQ